MFYKRFREIRQEKALSQEELSRQLGIKQTQYSRYERGRQEFPLHLVARFSFIMGCSVDYLLELTNDKKQISSILYPEYLQKEDQEKTIPNKYKTAINELTEEIDKIERAQAYEQAKQFFKEYPQDLQERILKKYPNFIEDMAKDFLNDPKEEKED